MNVTAPVANNIEDHQFSNRYLCSVQEMARLTNEGVGHLLAEDSRAALRCFAGALAIAQAPVHVAPANIANEEGGDPGVTSSSIRLSLSTPVPGLTDSVSHLYIQNQAIGFDLDPMLMVSAGPEHGADNTMHAVVATAILFDLALAYHHCGMIHQRVTFLRKACRFYRICVDQLIPALPSWTREQPGVILMTMGCRNNEAQLQYQFLGNPTAASGLANQVQGEMAPRMRLLQENPHLSAQFGEILLNINMLLSYSIMTAPVA